MVLKERVMAELADLLPTCADHIIVLNDGETYTNLTGCVLAYQVTHPTPGFRYYDLHAIINWVDHHQEVSETFVRSFELK